MKLTKHQLKQIIKEELQAILTESPDIQARNAIEKINRWVIWKRAESSFQDPRNLPIPHKEIEEFEKGWTPNNQPCPSASTPTWPAEEVDASMLGMQRQRQRKRIRDPFKGLEL